MDSATTVITGANGQLGKALQDRFPSARALDRDQLDITDAEAVKAFDWSNVSVLINAAAYTAVDQAETDEGRLAAQATNATAVEHLAAAAREHDLILVHISTDYVFDGTKPKHTEDEPFSPLSVYGTTKAAGDAAAATAPKHYILRASWVIGEGGNFVRSLLAVGAKGINPSVVGDQDGRLTFTDEIVRAIEHLVTTQAAYGTYNVSNSGEISTWADIARAIFEYAGYNLTVTDTTAAEYFKDKHPVAKRPQHSFLVLDKLQATGFTSTNWRDALAVYVKKELA